VVERDQVMVDGPFDEVEEAPPHEQQADELAKGQRPTTTGCPDQDHEAHDGEHPRARMEEAVPEAVVELQAQEGPCLDCYRTGEPVLNQDLASASGRWPLFAPEALAAGFESVHALPMRLRGAVIGALNLFHVDPGLMRPADITAAQAMADVATIAVLQHRASVEAQIINEQLSHALNSRVIIEQAKGMLSERVGIDVDEAFGQLRRHARNHNRQLVEVAEDVLDGRRSREAFNRPSAS
jgi:hypothetical protein